MENSLFPSLIEECFSIVFSNCRISVPPVWRQEPSDVSVPLGGSVEVPCLADGFPLPVISWRRKTGTIVALNKGLIGTKDWLNYVSCGTYK